MVPLLLVSVETRRGATEQRDELAPPHSITSSAARQRRR
jgi:hypothetical protein